MFLFFLLFRPGNEASKALPAELIRSEHWPALRVWVVVYGAVELLSRTDKT